MKRTPALAIAAFMILISLVVLVVAFAGADRGGRITALEDDLRVTKAQLAQTRVDLAAARAAAAAADARAMAATARADALQARVDALSAALLAMGVDPDVIAPPLPPRPAQPATASPAPTRQTAPGTASPSARPASTPPPSPSPSPSPLVCRVPLICQIGGCPWPVCSGSRTCSRSGSAPTASASSWCPAGRTVARTSPARRLS